GVFDEELVRNQDDEHNLRIAKGGGRVWQSSRIRSVYRPRAALSQVFRQYLQYGYWKPFVMRKHGQPASLRHVVPAAFVAAPLPPAALVCRSGGRAGPRAPLAPLSAAASPAMTAGVARDSRPGAAALVRVPAVIVTYHLSYGIGSLLGGWDALRHGRGRSRF